MHSCIGTVIALYTVGGIFGALSCVYLGDAGCTIHERAPYVCRKFDCRVRFLQWTQGEKGAAAQRDVLIAGGERLLKFLDEK